MPKPRNEFFLGIDLGGTKVEMVIVDIEGMIVCSDRFDTEARNGPNVVIDSLVKRIRLFLSDSGNPVTALGIGVAGQVIKSTGSIFFSPNLFWTQIPLRSLLNNALGIPVFVINDVRAGMLAEHKHGAGSGAKNMVCVFVGTGIGGGVISNGVIVEGESNSAAELGHTTIVVNGRSCRCPNAGCMEAYAGGWAISERAIELCNKNPESGKNLIEIAGSIDGITAATVSLAYHQKDVLACKIVEDTARHLGAGIVGIVNAFNPEILILGGGVINGIPDLLTAVNSYVRVRALPSAVENLKIVNAAFGTKSVAKGAAEFAIEQI